MLGSITRLLYHKGIFVFCFSLIFGVAYYSYFESFHSVYYFSIAPLDASYSYLLSSLALGCALAFFVSWDGSARCFTYFLFVYLLYLPMLMVAVFTDRYLEMVLAVVVSALIVWLPLPRRAIARKYFNFDISWVLVLVGAIVCALVYLKYGGTMRLVGFADVYELRSAVARDGYFYGVLLSASNYVIVPLMLVVGVYSKNYRLVLFAVFLALSMYAAKGYKTAIILPLVVVSLSFLVDRLGRLALVSMACFLSVLSILALVLSFSVFDFYPYFVERVLVAPGALFYAYVDFFSGNEKAYLGYSIFSAFIDYSYRFEPSFLIGSEYFSSGNRANASFVSDGFANFGFFGVIAYSAFVRVLVWMYDCISISAPAGVRVAVFMPYSLYMINASPITMLLTGGFFVLIIIFFLFRFEVE